MKINNISIIGSGNLATHLSINLENCGLNIVDVYSRDFKKAEKLTSKLYNAIPTTSLDFSSSSAIVFFLCVGDDAIKEMASKIILPENSILVHCSGSFSLASILGKNETGVFYPVQTFSKDRKISFENVPVCIEASSLATEKILESLATRLKAQPYFMNSEQRLTLHLSAVFACNFGNHLFSVAQMILKDQGLPFNLLHHLIAETVQKAIENEPLKMQTGPAIRKDLKTIALHEHLLVNKPNWNKLYQLFTNDINMINEY